MSLSKYALASYLAAVLTGCASGVVQDSGTASPTTPEPDYQAGELNQESLYELLLAEIAGQQRQFALAQSLTERQARLNHSAVLAERATRIAQFMRDADLVKRSANLWSTLEPGDSTPTQILVNLLLHEDRIDEALQQLSTEAQLPTELLLVIDSHLGRFNNEQGERLFQLLQTEDAVASGRLDIVLVGVKLLEQLQHYDQALRLIEHGLQVENHQADLVLEKARILARHKDSAAAALALIEPILNSNLDHRELRAMHIQLLLSEAPKRVRKAVNSAIEQSDRDPQLIFYYALLLLENNQLDLSERWFQYLLNSDPERKDLNLYLGVIEESRANSEAAIDYFTQVPAGEGLLNAASRTLGLLDTERDRDRAEVFINDAIRRDPERSEDLTILLARWYAEGGLTERALGLLNEAIQNYPDRTSLLYQRALLIEPLDPSQMLADLEQAHALEPNNPSLQNALGYSLLEHSDHHQRAYELIQQAYASRPDDPAILDSLGWALHKLGRSAEGVPYLRRAYESFPDPEVASHLIIVLTELGQIDAAQAIYDQLSAEERETDDIQEALRWLNRH